MRYPLRRLDDLLASLGLAGPPAQGRVLMEGVLIAELFANEPTTPRDSYDCGLSDFERGALI